MNLNYLIENGRPIPEVLGQIPADKLFNLALDSFSKPQAAQELVLKQILAHARNTEVGKRYHFYKITSIEDYRKMVTVSEWTDYEQYTERMAKGEADILFPGIASCFLATSGTTSNKPKLIPESVYGAVARNAVMQLRIIAINRHFPGILKQGFLLPLSNFLAGSKTEGGIPLTYASGMTLNQSLQGSTIRLAFPLAVFAVQDTKSLDYLIMRFAIQHKDVMLVAGNNAGRFRELVLTAASRMKDIIRDIEEGSVEGAGNIAPELKMKLLAETSPDPARAAELRQMFEKNSTLIPIDYWPSLQLMAFWLSAAVGHYIKDVKPLVPAETKFMDIGYGASEGKFNIPFELNKAAGALSVLTAFYEFIPEEGGSPLLAYELEDNKCYEMVITTWSGLYRYNLKDIVKVEGFTAGTPNLVFQYKSGEILNIAEEKIPASIVNESIRIQAKSMGIDILQVQVLADEKERRYLCYAEPGPETAGFDVDVLAEKVHADLTAKNFAYDLIVVRQKLVNPLKIIEMKTGWQQSLYLAKKGVGQSSTQVKLPVLIRQKPDDNWVK